MQDVHSFCELGDKKTRHSPKTWIRISMAPGPTSFIDFQSEGIRPCWKKLIWKPAARRASAGTNELKTLHADQYISLLILSVVSGCFHCHCLELIEQTSENSLYDWCRFQLELKPPASKNQGLTTGDNEQPDSSECASRKTAGRHRK
jgi:hypothetical protein